MVSMFDRKHYFYGDMPVGYQITQQRNPLAKDGILDLFVFTPGIHKSPYVKKVKIKQLQLEQDSGKSLHGSDSSLVDLNRAGMGLMEVVFEPDLTDGEEAAALVKELAGILKKIGTCTCKMEEGGLRVDANVSIHQEGEPLGTRTEIKNIGSFRGVASAVKYEIERQIKLKEKGYQIINETRAWDANTKSTVAMRDKEEKQDYRYMPEPNLPPLHLSNDEVNQGSVNVEKLRKSIPELPAQIRERLQKELGLTLSQAVILVNDSVLLQFFEDSMKMKQLNPKLLANILIYEFSHIIYKTKVNPEHFLNRSNVVADLVYLLDTRKINRGIFCYLLEELFIGNPKQPIEILQEENLFQITDEEELMKICKEVLNENENLVTLYRGGKKNVYKALMKILVNKSNERADMAKCDEIMKKLLNGE
ncbi:hypothetical protein HHI36_020445 [Cryptolaemus montrouzieri]|uniref:Asn/Gln amidotransferase domain-containing protein n=1 Tax=Cryptolaemus montrouzieri TaxID=559131 RepID=A0ABD2NB04_9CUCU